MLPSVTHILRAVAQKVSHIRPKRERQTQIDPTAITSGTLASHAAPTRASSATLKCTSASTGNNNVNPLP